MFTRLRNIYLALLTPLKAIYLGQTSGPDICFVKNKYYPFHNIHMQIYFCHLAICQT
jgi:hypothetical protein